MFSFKFKGIPPHISLLSEMQVMKVELNKMQETMLTEFKSELDDRGVGGAAFLNQGR